MIFYFTGTGNSGQVAAEVARANEEQVISIAKLMQEGHSLEFTLKKDEIIGFVYPIYAWAPPKIVMDFIQRATFHYEQVPYILAIATCGENIGNTMSKMKKALAKKEMVLSSGFSLVMPNNYNIMGDVDSAEETIVKLDQAMGEIATINEVIAKRESVFQMKKGHMPWLLTGVVNPLFQKHAIDDTRFLVTEACVNCGKCAKVCPYQNISLVDKKPKWNGNCCQCLACLNYCPTKAIEYGKATIGKGRYTNPYFKSE